ncbi:hypothetical protein WJX72_004343 [[Myrmecia] bisecta]|uniref:Uncharacterized protein n=1 Tax=[Myrmecia] bisecta TaxID=41462 RepID=A0AAW1QQ38_9CHLO
MDLAEPATPQCRSGLDLHKDLVHLLQRAPPQQDGVDLDNNPLLHNNKITTWFEWSRRYAEVGLLPAFGELVDGSLTSVGRRNADGIRLSLVQVDLGPAQVAAQCIKMEEDSGFGITAERFKDLLDMGRGWDGHALRDELSLHGCGLFTGTAGLCDDGIHLWVNKEAGTIKPFLLRFGPMSSAVQNVDVLQPMKLPLPDNFTYNPDRPALDQLQERFARGREWDDFKERLDLFLAGPTGLATADNLFKQFQWKRGLSVLLTCPPILSSHKFLEGGREGVLQLQRPADWPDLQLDGGRLRFETKAGSAPAFLDIFLANRYQVVQEGHPMRPYALPNYDEWAGGKAAMRAELQGLKVDFADGDFMRCANTAAPGNGSPGTIGHSEVFTIRHPDPAVADPLGYTVVTFAAWDLASRSKASPSIRRGYGPMMFPVVINPWNEFPLLEDNGKQEKVEHWLRDEGSYHGRQPRMKQAYEHIRKLAGGQLAFTLDQFLKWITPNFSAHMRQKPRYVNDLYLFGVVIQTTLNKEFTGASATKTDLDVGEDHLALRKHILQQEKAESCGPLSEAAFIGQIRKLWGPAHAKAPVEAEAAARNMLESYTKMSDDAGD